MERIMIYSPEMVNFGIVGKKDCFFDVRIFVDNGKGLRLCFGMN